jgi:uncharacterized phage protein (TIGR01671 family)
MREILFRGKRIDNSEWVYGDLMHKHYNFNTKADKVIHNNLMKYKVIPETIGQYTGLTDKNGKKIFEGDIVKCTDTFSDYEFIAVVMFGNPKGEYNWGFQLNRISGANANTDILLWVDMEETGAFIEVIGNIHDNPELLGGDTNV